MRWDAALFAVLGLIEGDDTVTGLIGGAGNLSYAGSKRNRVSRAIEYTVVSTTEGETFERLLVQLDYFAPTYDEVIAIERAVRRLLNRDLPEEVGGVWMFLQYLAGRDHFTGDDPAAGAHRSNDFLFQPVRDRTG